MKRNLLAALVFALAVPAAAFAADTAQAARSKKHAVVAQASKDTPAAKSGTDANGKSKKKGKSKVKTSKSTAKNGDAKSGATK